MRRSVFGFSPVTVCLTYDPWRPGFSCQQDYPQAEPRASYLSVDLVASPPVHLRQAAEPARADVGPAVHWIWFVGLAVDRVPCLRLWGARALASA